MKLILTLLAAAAASICLQSAGAQEFKEHISRALSATKIFAVYNLQGNVRIEGYSGDKVIVEIDKLITGTTQNDIERGTKEFQLGIEKSGDSIVVYIASPKPWDTRPNHRDNADDRFERLPYEINMDFVIKVPNNTMVVASTVNKGTVTVENVFGKLKLNNVNGGIRVFNAKNTTTAQTVNGEIDVTYSVNPSEPSLYSTVNGDIKVNYQPDLSAELYFKSMTGSYFINFEVEVINNKAETDRESRDSGTVHKINKSSAVKVGGGGQKFNFETLNGNIYIKKQD